MNHFRGEKYYLDFYDLLTIKRCLDFSKTPESKKLVDPKKEAARKTVLEVALYFIKGEEYKNKSQTINEWISHDKEKDEMIDRAVEPKEVCCTYCLCNVALTSKHLYHDDKRVMFWFRCPKCNKNKAIFDNGEEYVPEPKLCPRCSVGLVEKYISKNEIVVTFQTCPNCKYKNKETLDFGKGRKEWERKQKADSELLKKYRWKFCMSEKEGN